MRIASMRITGCGANRGMHRTNYDTVASMSAGVYANLAIWAGGTMTNLSGEASRRRLRTSVCVARAGHLPMPPADSCAVTLWQCDGRIFE